MIHRRIVGALFAAAVGFLLPAAAASAQDSTTPSTEVKAPTSADVELEIGAYDAALNDWPVTAVVVTGDIEEDLEFRVVLAGNSGQLWAESTTFAGPETRIPILTKIAVGDVTSAELSSALVLGALITPELGEGTQPGAGGGSTGQVATSMALVIIIAVILFRTPLPAASVQRWTR